VFNHTGEGDGRHGDASSLRGLDNSIYYIIDPASGFDRDYSGCGNTLNCNHPLVRELILDALHYWVAEMHVDGFRFDLASILGRGRNGEVLANPPLIERITEDPLLRDTTIIAEAWDAAGLYQVGKFPARWAEWNGPFRDDVRDFLRGAGSPDHLATRLAGSADLFHDPDRSPSHSINFVTSHDGFTLRDLVSYDQKHNRRNGEEDRDGCNDNRSWNCGAEGQSSDRAVLARRDRQVRNAFTILFLSQGTPMFLAGDELGRTQGGNNNAYCQDNETSWVDWSLETGNADLLDFVRRLIVFRKETPVLNRTTFFTGQPSPLTGLPDVIWHGAALGRPEFGSAARVLAMHLPGGPTDTRGQDVYFAVNAWTEPISFELPAPPSGSVWRLMFDTAAPDQRDNIVAGRALLQPHSCVVLRSEGRP
ncbi:MAG TPA: glycogen debranching enzyme, partial [Thermoanaerobaculia bacterium]|nr:glycogen debranching enzyme [Thermoanaerobaculia bacterium]